MGEATVPAEQPEAGHEARLSAPDVDAGGPSHHQGPSGQGSRPPVGLIWRVGDRATFVAFRHARRVRRGLLTVAWVGDDRGLPPRVAFAISTKVGPAVVRNRLRRRLRDLARHGALGSGAWMIIASPGAGQAPFSTLAGWFEEAAMALGNRSSSVPMGSRLEWAQQ